jgi:hypothetical protein
MMAKHISVIADEYLQQVQDLRAENAKLRQQLKDTAKTPARGQSNDYADDICADCEDGGKVAPALKGAR